MNGFVVPLGTMILAFEGLLTVAAPIKVALLASFHSFYFLKKGV
ncbi:hypothetical protein [Salicibibacter halophilus]|nr:hypothetical protein [Salicibibacter halophilus]